MILDKLRERRVPQIVGAYLAAGWLALQLVDQLVGNNVVPPALYRFALLTYLLGIPAAVALAWFHGRPGHQRFRRGELIALGAIAIIWIAVSAVVLRNGSGAAPAMRAATAPVESRIGASFVVVPFRNLTGFREHDWLIDGSPSLVNDVLGQWREITVVAPERMYGVLRAYDAQPGTAIGADVLSKIARRTGASSIVAGEVLKTGENLTVKARVYDAKTGLVVIDTKEQVAGGEDVRDAYARLSIRLLRAAGVADANVDLRSITTQSLEAYKAYATGVSHLQRAQHRSAEAAFRQAVEKDSTFAQAWAQLATVSMMASLKNLVDERSPSYGYAAKAEQLAARLPERQRRFVVAMQNLRRGQFQAARNELLALLKADSTNVDALMQLAEIELTDPLILPDGRIRGSWNSAAKAAERILEIDPTRLSAFRVLTQMYTRIAEPIARNVPPSNLIHAFRTDQPTLVAYMRNLPDEIYQVVLRDTIVILPISKAAAWPADSLKASKARARAKARVWVNRWLAAAPRSADAHAADAQLAALEQNISAALAAQQTAEQLSPALDAPGLALNRVGLLARQRRFDAALAVFDSVIASGYFDDLDLTGVQSEGIGWGYALYLMRADSSATQRLMRTFGKPLRTFIPAMVAGGILPKAPQTEEETENLMQSMSIAIFASTKQGEFKRGQYAMPTAAPPAILFEALDSLRARPGRIPRSGMMVETIPQVFIYAAFAADSATSRRQAARAIDLAIALAKEDNRVGAAQRLADSAIEIDPALRARVEKLPWFMNR